MESVGSCTYGYFRLANLFRFVGRWKDSLQWTSRTFDLDILAQNALFSKRASLEHASGVHLQDNKSSLPFSH